MTRNIVGCTVFLAITGAALAQQPKTCEKERSVKSASIVSVLEAVQAGGGFKDLKPIYDYDAQQPLDVEEKLLHERDGVRVYDLTYASPKGGRVTAYLVTPGGKGPYAGLLFGHWGPGNRTEFLPEATLHARAGAVSLLIDYPWVRPAPWRKRLKNADDPESDHQAFVQAVVDLRRGLDLLAARPEVDAKRLAYVGHSYGAQWGAILSAVEPRLKGAVLMAGVPDQAAIYRDSSDPGIVELRESLPKGKLEKYLESCDRTAAVRYVPHSACPLLMQFARYERYFDKAAMDRYAAAAREPKEVKWYDTGHELNDPQALRDRTEWLREKVGLSSPDKKPRAMPPPIMRLQHEGMRTAVAFSPDGRTLATGGLDNHIYLWDVATRKLRLAMPAHSAPAGISRLGYFADGKTLVSASWAGDGTVKLWDVANGRERRLIGKNNGGIAFVAISPDGNFVAWNGGDGKIHIHDVIADREARLLHLPLAIDSAAFSPDSKLLATANGDGTVRLWDIATGETVRVLPAAACTATGSHAIAFHRDGSTLITAGRKVKLWKAATGEELGELDTAGDDPFCVATSADGRYVAVGTFQGLHLWDWATRKEIHYWAGAIASLAFSPDGALLAIGSRDPDGGVGLVAIGEPAQVMPAWEPIGDPAFERVPLSLIPIGDAKTKRPEAPSVWYGLAASMAKDAETQKLLKRLLNCGTVEVALLPKQVANDFRPALPSGKSQVYLGIRVADGVAGEGAFKGCLHGTAKFLAFEVPPTRKWEKGATVWDAFLIAANEHLHRTKKGYHLHHGDHALLGSPAGLDDIDPGIRNPAKRGKYLETRMAAFLKKHPE